MVRTWQTAKELKAELPARDDTEAYVHVEAKYQIRYYVESVLDQLVGDHGDGWSFMTNLAEPDESGYGVSMYDSSMVARLWMAEQFHDENDEHWSDDANAYILSWPHKESLKGAITGLANRYVTTRVTVILQGLFERLSDALSFLGVQGDMHGVTVYDHDPLADPRQPSESVEHPLGRLTYYSPTGITHPPELANDGETMVLHVEEYGFYLAFVCSVCGGIPPCGTCHDMSGAARSA